MMTASPSTQQLVGTSAGSLPNSLDASRGAGQFGLGCQVWLHNEVLDAYGELDPAVGRNVVGAVLAALGSHVASGRSFGGTELVPVCLRRRQDGNAVEVELRVRRVRRGGRECLAVTAAEEREAAL